MRPAELRDLDDLRPGDELEVERLASGEHLVRRRTAPNEGVVDWLLACPEKGYFVPITSEDVDSA